MELTGIEPHATASCARYRYAVARETPATQASALAGESKHPDIVLLLATTGLRWGEVAALRVRDIDSGVAGSASGAQHRR